jgi:SpoVK/Ycf46/Vps4 family AAA+-type ATPase
LTSKYLGESEAQIRRLFATAAELAPCIVCIDNIDAIACNREDAEQGATSKSLLLEYIDEEPHTRRFDFFLCQ